MRLRLSARLLDCLTPGLLLLSQGRGASHFQPETTVKKVSRGLYFGLQSSSERDTAVLKLLKLELTLGFARQPPMKC
jgi:hypothetical protein